MPTKKPTTTSKKPTTKKPTTTTNKSRSSRAGASASGDAALAAKLLAAKDPRKTLDKLVGKAAPATVWRLLATGLVPFRGALADAAGCCADKTDPTIVMQTLAHLDLESLREESVVWAFANSYREHPATWEAALPTLRSPAHELLAIVRAQQGKVVDAPVVDRVLDVYAAAAADGKNTYSSRLVEVVEPVSPPAPFHQRVLAHAARSADSTLSSDLVHAFEVAPWETFAALVRKHPLDHLESHYFEEMLAKRTDTAHDLYALFTASGNEITGNRAQSLLQRAHAQGTEVPPLDDVLIERLAGGFARSPEITLAIQGLPPARRAAFVEKLRATETREYSVAGLLDDPTLDAEIVGKLVAAVRDHEEWSDIEDSLTPVLGELYIAGPHAITLLDRAQAELETDPAFAATHIGAQLRLLFRRVKFMASRGQSPRPLELVLPGTDLPWVPRVGDAIGNMDPLEGLSDHDVDRLFTAWRALDWDDTLCLINDFGPDRLDASPIPAIEDRPWEELAALVAQTSFDRLRDGESDSQSLTRLFGRSEPLAQRIELARQIGIRERAFTAANPGYQLGLAAMMRVLGALAPHLIAAKTPLPEDLAAIALDLLRLDIPDEIRDLLLALPRTQVDGWISTLCSDKAPKVKKRGKEYAKLVASN